MNQAACCFGTVQTRAALEPSRPTDRHVGEVEHEHTDVSGGRQEDDWWRWSHNDEVVSNTGRGLAVGGTGAFSSATMLRFVDLDGLPQDNTFVPLNTRSLMDARRRARELTPPARRAKRE